MKIQEVGSEVAKKEVDVQIEGGLLAHGGGGAGSTRGRGGRDRAGVGSSSGSAFLNTIETLSHNVEAAQRIQESIGLWEPARVIDKWMDPSIEEAASVVGLLCTNPRIENRYAFQA